MGRKLMHQLVRTLCSSAREADDHVLADVGILGSPRYSLVLKLDLSVFQTWLEYMISEQTVTQREKSD